MVLMLFPISLFCPKFDTAGENSQSKIDRSSEEVVRVEADASFFSMSTVYPPVPSTPTGGPALMSIPAMPLPMKASVTLLWCYVVL